MNKFTTFLLLAILLLLGCSSSTPPTPTLASQETSQTAGNEVSELPPFVPSVEDTVPEIMSEPSGDEVLIGLQQGQPAPFSGVLLNSFGAAWLESEPDATQERCQLFVTRRLGELHTTYGARIQILELQLSTQERVQTIELRNRDLQLNSLRELNEQLRNSSGQWWEQILWYGAAGVVGAAIGIIISLVAN